jgi:hypothetical protein
MDYIHKALSPLSISFFFPKATSENLYFSKNSVLKTVQQCCFFSEMRFSEAAYAISGLLLGEFCKSRVFYGDV